ncbi:MAG: hypothetical protein JNM08_17430 [Rubrivivax sp.]|nr:hypothetical protein [Rubrivivax sp.]
MITSPQEMQAVSRAADLEPMLARLEACLTALARAQSSDDSSDIESRAADLHRALASVLGPFAQAARNGGVPHPLRERLAICGSRVAAQREALARATAALDRAIDLLLPEQPGSGLYGSGGGADRASHSAHLQA